MRKRCVKQTMDEANMSEDRCWATLGAFDEKGDGRIVELDANTGTVNEIMQFEQPPRLRVAGKGFTGGTWLSDGKLAVCGASAVYFFVDGVHKDTWALPSFNDLHGLCAHGNRIYVVNTGLDTIDVFNLDGQFRGSHSFETPWLATSRILGDYPERSAWSSLHDGHWNGEWPKFEPETLKGPYYSEGKDLPFNQRRVRDLVHLNHAMVIDERLLVTSLARKEVIEVDSWCTVARFDTPPHDGVVLRDSVWFTRIDGWVESRSRADLNRITECIDISEKTGIYGWCRGLRVTENLLWVGFTAIHHSPRYTWNRVPFASTQTAVVCIERSTNDIVARFELDSDERHVKVGALLAAP